MEENPLVNEEGQAENSWKIQALVIGGVLGALVGIGGAYLMTRRAEQKGTTLAITPRKGMQLGMMITGLLRSIVSLGED